MKVEYCTLGGLTSKAYLDIEPVAPNTYAGEDKYTDEPVRVMWDDERQVWLEIDVREVSPGEQTREFYREQGRAEEQARIIKLLTTARRPDWEDDDTMSVTPLREHGGCQCCQNMTDKELIALIKGESK